LFTIHAMTAPASIGFEAQSPAGDGCVVTFDESASPASGCASCGTARDSRPAERKSQLPPQTRTGSGQPRRPLPQAAADRAARPALNSDRYWYRHATGHPAERM
jgi:hypothetical protein